MLFLPEHRFYYCLDKHSKDSGRFAKYFCIYASIYICVTADYQLCI